MEFPNLKKMCDLICSYSPYASYTAIAKQLGLRESTLRGYWERYGGKVPDKNADRFAALVQDVAPIPLTKDAALNLLGGSPLALHNVLLPIEGDCWRTLIDEQLELRITMPPPPAFGFGQVDDEDVLVADETVGLDKPFRFQGHMPWDGEGFLVAEHRGEWHLLPLDGSQRGFEFSSGKFDLPLSKNGKPRYLRERELPGFYRYAVIGLKDGLPGSLRHQIHRANPYSQLELDLLGSMLLQTDPAGRIVLAATLRVTSG